MSSVGPDLEGLSREILADLRAVTQGFDALERSMAEHRTVVDRIDGRLEGELDTARSDVDDAIRSLRDDVAAAIAQIRGEVDRRLTALEAAARDGGG